jgi:hypothetical protein
VRGGLLALLLAVTLGAGEYDDFAFDGAEYEKKAFEADFLLRSDSRGMTRDGESVSQSRNELNAKAVWQEEAFALYGDLSYHHTAESDKEGEGEGLVNELYARIGDEKNVLEAGKRTLRWGKGYAYSPVALFERPKDPVYPERSKEGYVTAQLQLTRTTANDTLKNWSATLLYFPRDSQNDTLFETTDSQWGARFYALLFDTDIDIIAADNAAGADFSTNLTPWLELHGEYATKDDRTGHLAGISLETWYDLKLIAETYVTFDEEHNRYYKLSQKEPFGLYYASVYYLKMINETREQTTAQVGFTYDFKNGFTVDLARLETMEAKGWRGVVQWFY